MKKLIFPLLFCLGVLLPQALLAQSGHTSVIVGTGTSSNYYAPFNPFYKNSTSETIYTATEIGTAGTIDTIWFYSASTSPFSCTSLKVYLGSTTQSNFSTTSSWILENSLELVYSATNTSIAGLNGWFAIPLQTPWFYDGVDNLVVAVTKTASSYSSSCTWRYTSTSSQYRVLYRQNDSDAGYGSLSSLTSSTTGTSTYERPNVKLSMDTQIPSCSRPSSLTISNLSYNSARVNWTGCNDANYYELCYGTTPNVNTYANNAVSVYDEYYDLYQLDDSTTYYVWVRSVCDTSTTAWSLISFTTQVACATVVNAVVDSIFDNDAVVRWSVDTAVGQPLQHVVLEYRALDESTWTVVEVLFDTTYALTGLQDGTEYIVRITSICDYDTSNAVTLQFRTTTCGEYADGTTTSSYVPFYGLYDYGYSQTIYPGNALAGATTITGISFQTYSAPSSYTTRTISISMGNTTRTSLSTSSYIDESTLTHVVTNYGMDVSTPGWIYIPFTTPFVYDGTSNVVVTVTNLTGDYSSFMFYHHATTVGNSVYWYRDGTPISGTSPGGTSGTTSTVPNVRFDADCGGSSSGCTRPTDFTDDDVTYNSIDLSWTGCPYADSYEVRYGTDPSVTASTAVTESSTSEMYTLTGLRGYTTYYIWVRSVCGDETSQWSVPIMVTTLQSCAMVLDAQVVDTNETNASISWSINTSEGQTLSSVVVAWHVVGETTWDSMEVLSSTSCLLTNLRSGVNYEVQVISVCGGDSSAAVTLTFTTPACYEYANGTATNSYVPFYGLYSYGYSQIIYPPTNLSGADTIYGISFRVASVPSSYRTRTVSISMGNTTRTSVATSSYISESLLTHVVTNYPMDVSSVGWTYIPFTTPFVYDGTSNLVVTVTNLTGSYSSFNFYHHTPTVGNAIYWYRDGTPISGTSPGGTSGTTSTVPDIRFDAPCALSGCMAPILVVGTVTGTSIDLNWAPMGAETDWIVGYKASGENVWTYTRVTTPSHTLTGLAPQTHYALRVGVECDNDTIYAAASATTLNIVETCLMPINLQAVASSTESSLITVSWTPQGGESQWQVEVTGNGLDSLFFVSTTTTTVLGLDSGATYEVRVRAVCDEEDTSRWTSTVSVIPGYIDLGCQPPLAPEIITVTDSSVVLSWTPVSRERRWQVRIYNFAYDSLYRAYSNYVALAGMQVNTTYNVAVRAICGIGDTSDWSPVSYFTTHQTAISDGARQPAVHIYPNPATLHTQIDIQGVTGLVGIEIIDPSGRVVHTDQLPCSESCDKSFSVEGLARGAYFVRIISDNFSTVRKLFVQ